MSNWRFVSTSEPVTWTVTHHPRGCWKCRLRARLHRPRPYRHFNCGPAEKFPGTPSLSDLL